MKKMLSLLFVLCCFVSLIPLSASAKYDKEILFRNIPWGSTMDEALDALSDLDAEWDTPYMMPYRDITDILTYQPAKYSEYLTIGYIETTKVNETIAGYDLKSITLYFANTDNERPYKENTSLYMAVYEFDNDSMSKSQKENLVENVRKSLVSVYGKIDNKNTIKTKGVFATDYIFSTINGSNKSSVCFINEILSSWPSSARIVYMGGDGAEIAKKNMEEQKKNTPINTNGL